MHDQPAAAGRIGPPSDSPPAPSAQQLFEQGRSATSRPALRAVSRLLAGLGKPARAAIAGSEQLDPRHLHGLRQHGVVLLHGRRTPVGRRWVDHLLVAPSGIYVVEDRPWRGEVAASGDWLYVDGRLRSGVPESVRRTAQEVQAALADELGTVGVGVTPVLCLPEAADSWQAVVAEDVAVFAGRGLARHLRRAQPLLGRDTVVRLALTADSRLEQGSSGRTS
ncbi:MAG TPA: nuclease-related domain-containing protein [Candidatus Limnocylindrales bacterium]|nr:nuclease-related domain-containing protein [Candidatus Limnocylindrales bacterium]